MQFIAQYAISKQFSSARSDRMLCYLLQTYFSERLANAEYKIKIIFGWKKILNYGALRTAPAKPL